MAAGRTSFLFLRPVLAWAGLVLAALMLTACAGSGGPDAPSASALSLPKLPDLTSALPEGPGADPTGSATELYARIARGAVGCWFGAEGGMKKDYIYHAEADAPSRGGKAEVTIHVRDPSQPNPRGAKAYKILITPKDEQSATVTTENLKLPDEKAKAMTDDVNRWSRGEQGCKGATTTAGWSAPDGQAKAPEAKPAAKTAPVKNAKAKAPAAAAKP